MSTSENVKWVIVEVLETPGQEPELFVSPGTLKLEHGWLGQIVWYVFTNGWQLRADNGIVFTDTGFEGAPALDPVRPFCWSTAAASEAPGSFHYTITAVRKANPLATAVSVDPVVENEAPPTLQVLKLSSVV